MRKKGFTAAGVQRWKCDDCSLSATARRADLTRMAEFRAFLAWVTGKESLSEAAARLGVVRQTFASRTAWCWNVAPRIAKDGVVHRCIEVDGTYLPYGWCLLIATGPAGAPIAWQWCDGESKAAYRRLFAKVREPGVLVTDGGAGCLAVARERWKRARVQRCLVHVLRNTRTDLTGRPRTGAGRELLKLAKRIARISQSEQAVAWLVGLNRWHEEHGAFIKERTHAKDDPLHAHGRKWWWTHERVRRAYYRFIRLQRDRMLFAFLEPELARNGPVASTTNRLEGGVNATIKRVIHQHRGLSEPHMRRACEWAVYQLSDHPDPESFVTPECWNRATPQERHDTEPTPGTDIAVQLPAPGINAYEHGFGIRKGWAGHT